MKSGEEFSDKQIFGAKNKKNVPAKKFSTKNYPTKNVSTNDIPTQIYRRRMIRRIMFLAKNFPTKNFPTKNFPAKNFTTKNPPAKNSPGTFHQPSLAKSKISHLLGLTTPLKTHYNLRFIHHLTAYSYGPDPCFTSRSSSSNFIA
jgi:hypothetical protein